MKLHNNDTVFDDSNIPDRHSPLSQRILALVLIAIPCLMIVFGLITGTLIKLDASNIIYGTEGYIPTAIIVVLIAVSYSLFRNNPRLRRASMVTFRSYAQSVIGLDEREKLVIDQAFRTSYRIIALTCALVLACAVINVQTLHLAYHPGTTSVFYIMFGTLGLLIYLPTAIVAWKEEV
jgi:hypothetical protein